MKCDGRTRFHGIHARGFTWFHVCSLLIGCCISGQGHAQGHHRHDDSHADREVGQETEKGGQGQDKGQTGGTVAVEMLAGLYFPRIWCWLGDWTLLNI